MVGGGGEGGGGGGGGEQGGVGLHVHRTLRTKVVGTALPSVPVHHVS